MKLSSSKLERWIKALRSGRYKQATGALHKKNNKYCCLGVLCKLNGIKFKTMRVTECDDNDNSEVYDEIKQDLLGEKLTDKLTDMNDNGDSFKTIADYLEVV